MPPMSEPDGLSDLEEKVLLALWKLSSIGQNKVEERALKAELGTEPPQDLVEAIDELRKRVFLEVNFSEEEAKLSLTPLGLAILRKLEEDRLHELK